MSEKRRFFAVYDYGMGGVWVLMHARSAREIPAKYPQLEVVKERPDWLDTQQLRRLEADWQFDIDDPPLGWLTSLKVNEDALPPPAGLPPDPAPPPVPGSLPDLDRMPSVLRPEHVSEVLARIVEASEADPSIPAREAADLMVDAIFAQAHAPGVHLDESVSNRVLRWIGDHWSEVDESDLEFADAVTTVLVNLQGRDVSPYVQRLLAGETREPVAELLRECLQERERSG